MGKSCPLPQIPGVSYLAKSNWKELGQAVWNGLVLVNCKLHSLDSLCESAWPQIWVTLVIIFCPGIVEKQSYWGSRLVKGTAAGRKWAWQFFPTSLFGVNFGSVCPAQMFAFPSVDVLIGSSPACQRKHLEVRRQFLAIPLGPQTPPASREGKAKLR